MEVTKKMKNINLVETIFKKNWPFKSCILCTYGLNLNFFENYLMKLDALNSCENISIFTDSVTYDSIIKESYKPRWLNKKYLVNRIKTGGVFHSKLYMFASEKKAVVGIGSANLTRDGIASNLEILSTFEISKKKSACAFLLSDCIDYAKRLAQNSKSKNAVDQIDVFSDLCRPYLYHEEKNGIKFIHNLDQPIIETIKKGVEDLEITKVQVLSPFYDAKLAPIKTLKKFYPNSEFEIYLQQNKTNFPKDVFDKLNSSTSLLLYKNIKRYMHGKAILLHSNDDIMLFSGSANFTRSALNLTPPKGNYEIGLLGHVDRKSAEALLRPSGKIAKKVKNTKEIESNLTNEFPTMSKTVEYITEAVLKKSNIMITVNKDIPPERFTPTKFKLRDIDDNVYEENIPKNLIIKLTQSIKKKIPGQMVVQILGQDEKGNPLESNLLWVIELEEKSGNNLNRRFRRIDINPFELISVLYEILETGDKEELQHFLQQFDIPLDLVIQPRNHQAPKRLESKGNVQGALSVPHSYIFSADIREIYDDCLNRLYEKLKTHVNNPQVNKLHNFIIILSSLYSLIWFINTESIYKKYKNVSVITTDIWALIRDYYDMLFQYIDQSLELIWANGGYRDSINTLIADGQNENIGSFEQFVSKNYNYTFDEIIGFAFQTVEHFSKLKNNLRVKTDFDNNGVKPRIFPNNHMYLQPEAIHKIREAINETREAINKTVEILNNTDNCKDWIFLI